MKTNWTETRVLILGAARQGLALARLVRCMCRVSLSDTRSEDELRLARESLAEYPIQWALGGHPLDLLDLADVLCLSGGIPLTLPIVAEAVKRCIFPSERFADLHGSSPLQNNWYYRFGWQNDNHDIGRTNGKDCLWR